MSNKTRFSGLEIDPFDGEDEGEMDDSMVDDDEVGKQAERWARAAKKNGLNEEMIFASDREIDHIPTFAEFESDPMDTEGDYDEIDSFDW